MIHQRTPCTTPWLLGALSLGLAALILGCNSGGAKDKPAASRGSEARGSARAAAAAPAPGPAAQPAQASPGRAAGPAAGPATGPRKPPAAAPEPAAPVPDVQILSHDLEVTLDPERHAIEGHDVLHLRLARPGIDRIHFLLHKDLALTAVTLAARGEPKPAPFSTAPVNVFEAAQPPPAKGPPPPADPGAATPTPHGAVCIEVRVPEPGPAGECVLAVSYRGSIYAPPEATEKVRFVVGDRTAGTIGSEGVYLSPEAAWYPIIPDAFSTYTVAARTPAGWEVVGQDNLVARREENGQLLTVWSSNIPANGYHLVAGRYLVTNESFDGITLSTYLFEEEKDLAPAYLKAAKEFIAFYGDLLARYPYRRFSIVENFFSTGYGMPSYTLLGREVVKMGGRYLGASGLGHEILHCWWGNYVFVDPRDGNWCEGLTSYCSNYYYVEATEGPAKARESRRHTLVRFATLVPPGGDYPVRQFQGKTTEIDNEVGYSKCSFLFHAVRRQVGDPAFWEGLRRLIRVRGGAAASWTDIRSAFESTSGQDLKELFLQMLDRPGAPVLKLGPVAAVQKSREPERYLVSATVEQVGEPWRIALPVVAGMAPGERVAGVDFADRSHSVSVEVDAAPLSLALDPDCHVFRRFARAEIAPCLNLTFGDARKLLVTPAGGGADADRVYRALAERLAGQGGWTVRSSKDVTDEELAGGSVFALGSPGENPVSARILKGEGFPGPSVQAEGVTFGTKTYATPGNAFLVSGTSPFSADHTASVFWGMTPGAAEKATRLLFYYGWKGWYAFEEGKKVAEGDLAPEVHPLEYRFPAAAEGAGSGAGGAAEEGGAERASRRALVEHVRRLSAPLLEGRGMATAGGRAAADYVVEGFRAAGLKPLGRGGSFLSEVEVASREPGGGQNRLTAIVPPGAGEEARTFAAGQDFVPFLFAPKAEASGGLVFAGYGIAAPDGSYDDYAGADVTGKVVLVLSHVPREGETDGPFAKPPRAKLGTEGAKALAAQERGAAALLIAVDGKHAGFPPDDFSTAVWQEYLPKKLRDRVASPEAKKQNWTAEYLATSAQARATWPDEAVKIPCVLVAREVADALIAPLKMTLEQAQAKIETRLAPVTAEVPGVSVTCETAVATRRTTTHNVIGLLEGSDRELGHEYVVLGAHYDHLGQGPEGRLFPGANDNASGVAALLEVARLMAAARERPRRSVVFIAFGGEEWGLWGSRAYCEAPAVPLKRTIAMVNMDMLARGEPKELFVIGVLRNPELFDLVKRANGKGGMDLKGTIEFAFNHGSDHYPFHQARVPALDVTSSLFPGYHTAEDTPDRLDAGKLVNATELVRRVIGELAASDVRFPPPKDVEVPYPARKEGGKPGEGKKGEKGKEGKEEKEGKEGREAKEGRAGGKPGEGKEGEGGRSEPGGH